MSSQEVSGTPTRASRRKSSSQQPEDVTATPDKALSQVKRHMELKLENSPSTPGRRGSRAVNSPLAKKAMIGATPTALDSPLRRTTRSMSQEKELQPPPATFTRITRRRSSLMESEDESDAKNESMTRPTTSLRATASRKSVLVNQTISEEVGEELNNSTDNELELRTRSISKSPNVSAHSPLSMSIVDKSHAEKPIEIVDMSICTSPKTPRNQQQQNGAQKQSSAKSSEKKRKSLAPAVSDETANDLMQTQLTMNQSMDLTVLNTSSSKLQDKKRFSLPAPASPQAATAKTTFNSKKSLPASFDDDKDTASPVKAGWDQSYKSNAGSRIDRIVTPVVDGIRRLFSPSKSSPAASRPEKIVKTIQIDSDESDDDDDEENEKNPFVDDKCEVNNDAEDGDDTMSEDEKEYLALNAVEERGEILGSDDTEEDEVDDEEEDHDSFINDDEEVENQYSMSSDEDEVEEQKVAKVSRIIPPSSSDESENEQEEKPATPLKVKSPAGQLNKSAAKLDVSRAEKIASPKTATPAKPDKSMTETKTPAKSAEKTVEKIASSKKESAKKAKTPVAAAKPESAKRSAKRKHDSDSEDEEQQEEQIAEEKRGKKRKLDESLNVTVNGESVITKKRLKLDDLESEQSSSDESDVEVAKEDEPMDASSEDSDSEVAADKKNIHEAVVETCSDYMAKYNEEKRKREALKRIRKAEKLAKKKEEAAAKDQSDSSKENSTIKKKKKNKRKIKKTKSVEEAHQSPKDDVGIIAAEIAARQEQKRLARIEKKKLKKQMKAANAAAAATSSSTEKSPQVPQSNVNGNNKSNDLTAAKAGKKKLKKQNAVDEPTGSKRKFADVLAADHEVAAEKPKKKKLKIVSTVDESAPTQKKKQPTKDTNQVDEIKLNSTSSKIRKIVQKPVVVEKKMSKKQKNKKIPENRPSLPRPVWSSSGVWIEEPRTPFKFTKQKYAPAAVNTPEAFSVAKLKSKSKSAEVLPRMDIRTASVLQKKSERDGSLKNLKGLMSSKSTRNW